MLAVARTLGWCLGSALVALMFALTDEQRHDPLPRARVRASPPLGAVFSVSRGAFPQRR